MKNEPFHPKLTTIPALRKLPRSWSCTIHFFYTKFYLYKLITDPTLKRARMHFYELSFEGRVSLMKAIPKHSKMTLKTYSSEMYSYSVTLFSFTLLPSRYRKVVQILCTAALK